MIIHSAEFCWVDCYNWWVGEMYNLTCQLFKQYECMYMWKLIVCFLCLGFMLLLMSLIVSGQVSMKNHVYKMYNIYFFHNKKKEGGVCANIFRSRQLLNRKMMLVCLILWCIGILMTKASDLMTMHVLECE